MPEPKARVTTSPAQASALSATHVERLQQLRSWFASPVGAQLLDTETAVLEQLLGEMFGYHLLQVSIQDRPLFESSPVQHKVSLGLVEGDAAPALASPTNLPFADDSVDVALVHHLMDFVESPQEALRELSRVVRPMGHLVIVGFNPLSLWGVWKLFASFRRTAPWNGQFILPGRLMDWMNLLNYRIDRAQYCAYGPPVSRWLRERPDYSQGLSRKANWPVGAAYVIAARKQVGTMTQIRPIWRSQRAFGRLSVVQSAVSSEAMRSDKGQDSMPRGDLDTRD